MNQSGAIRAILADDHAVIRVGVRQFLGHAPDNLMVVEADDSEKARVPICRHMPDVDVPDLRTAKATGIDVARWAPAVHSEIGVLALAANDDPYVIVILQAGANSYLLKTARCAAATARSGADKGPARLAQA